MTGRFSLTSVTSNPRLKENGQLTATIPKSKIIAVGIAAALMIALLGAFSTQSATAATAQTVNWQISMHPSAAYPNTTGAAQYQAQPGQRDLQVELEHLRALAGKYVTFYANGSKFGTAKVTSTGIVQIDRNTELGQSVPLIVHGSTVAARTSTGTLIAKGQF